MFTRKGAPERPASRDKSPALSSWLQSIVFEFNKTLKARQTYDDSFQITVLFLRGGCPPRQFNSPLRAQGRQSLNLAAGNS